jgi:hypothetical protein
VNVLCRQGSRQADEAETDPRIGIGQGGLHGLGVAHLGHPQLRADANLGDVAANFVATFTQPRKRLVQVAQRVFAVAREVPVIGVPRNEGKRALVAASTDQDGRHR